MNLKNTLKGLDRDTQVQIGSKSAFFFMGTPDEFFDSVLDLNCDWHEKFTQAAKVAKKKYESMLAQPPEVGKSVFKKVWENCRQIIKEFTYEEALADYEKHLSMLKVNSETADAILKRFTKFETRKVLEVYKNIDGNAVIILIEGDECGKFWLRSEWDRYKNGETIVIDSELEDDEEQEEVEDEN